MSVFDKRCLSIQSHVVHGYVGNKSATFPLQLLGFDVDPLNSVQLSCHTGYKSFKGQILSGDELAAIIAGLKENALLPYSHVLTGYVSSPTFLRTIADVVRAVRDVNPAAQYVCDPVMGDHGKLYVPPELVPIYRDTIVPLASILTPNQYECELLSGVTITDTASALAAIDVLHGKGAQTVVITSSALPAGQDAEMLFIASCPWDLVSGEWSTVFAGVDRAAHPHAQFTIAIPKLASVFTGSGDLTAALLLAHSNNSPGAFVSACEKTLATVAAVCKRTMASYEECAKLAEAGAAAAAATAAAGTASAGADGGAAAAAAGSGTSALDDATARKAAWLAAAGGSTSGQMGKVLPAFNELRIVQSKADIEHPVVTDAFKAKPLATAAATA